MTREVTETKTFSLYTKFLKYVLKSLDYQQLVGVVAGIVVRRQVLHIFAWHRTNFHRDKFLRSVTPRIRRSSRCRTMWHQRYGFLRARWTGARTHMW